MELNFPKIEEKILKFWQKNKIFEKSISQRKGKPLFSFYDGPPFATGKPHYGHILATAIKDTVLRYFAMRGYQVPRRVGWDCHGLPVENLIEKELGIKNKKEIEKFGIEKFNQACRASVFRCVKDFEATLKRVGRWADYKNTYATLDSDYIESVWWVLKQLWEKGLVYKDYRVCPYCPRCGTPLSNFEVNQGYKDIKETSVYLKFKIINKEFKDAFFLAWTTTPWTLPGNVALAAHPEADYILVKQGGENYILAKDRKDILKEGYQTVKSFSGKDLVGIRYEPLFGSLVKQKIKNIENGFQVLPADFVSLKEGTGIVHSAVMYGEEDFKLGKTFNLPAHHTVDESGLFLPAVEEWASQFVKSAEPQIIANLEKRGLLYKKEETFHSYPFCWRCDSPLLYYAFESWYIRVTKIKKNLVSNNRKIHWVPEHIKEGRFGKWLEGARDWAFSRNRFWGSPLPIWQCQTGKVQGCDNVKVVGSIKELEKLSGKKPKDLHRPYIDEITFRCEKCGGEMKRVAEVFDCWFESGSMPYAQWHYPFENKELVEKTFPADFIAEGLDQTRGWFYTLHIIASALTLRDIGLGRSQPAFENVIVNGLVLDSQGRKLSKKLGNYPEPNEIFNLYGADSLRYFLLASTPMGEDYLFSSKGVEDGCQKVVSTLWNSYLFFETYKDKDFKPRKNFKPKNALDQWIVSQLQELNRKTIYCMDQYEITKAAKLFGDFIDDLSNWYIRRSRRKFQNPERKKEKKEASLTLYQVLKSVSQLMAPFLPFISEQLYQNLKLSEDKESVHLCDFPRPREGLINKGLGTKMKEAREIAASALSERAKAKIKVRQPLNELRIANYELKNEPALAELIKEEVNVKKITFGKSLKLNKEITPELKEEGILREFVRHIQEMRKNAHLKPKDKISIYYSGEPYLNSILDRGRKFILKETQAKDFLFWQREKQELTIEKKIKIDGLELWLGIRAQKV